MRSKVAGKMQDETTEKLRAFVRQSANTILGTTSNITSNRTTPSDKKLSDFYGKLKGSFGDGQKYQKKIRE